MRRLYVFFGKVKAAVAASAVFALPEHNRYPPVISRATSLYVTNIISPNSNASPIRLIIASRLGGERQRLGLARAFLHDAPLMLLDEPTSNLDSLNEAIILKSLREARDDKTVVLVSHRASTMRIADKIYSVESGRLS